MVDKILAAADTAPTAGNFQGFKVFYIKNQKAKIDLTFSSLIIPIQIELKPKPDAASNENPAAKVASWIENFSKISGGKFIFTLDGSSKPSYFFMRFLIL